VQVDPIKPKLKAPGTKRLKVEPDKTAFTFRFQIQLAQLHHGNADVVGRLIAAGADVDKPCKMDDRDTATPLFLAWRCRLTLG
jgi:hypothetical protein